MGNTIAYARRCRQIIFSLYRAVLDAAGAAVIELGLCPDMLESLIPFLPLLSLLLILPWTDPAELGPTGFIVCFLHIHSHYVRIELQSG